MKAAVSRACPSGELPLYSDVQLNALQFTHEKTSTGSRLCFYTLSWLLFFVSGTNRPFWFVCFAFLIGGHVTLQKRIGTFKCCAVHAHYACITSKDKRQIPLRTSRGLNWENKIYKSEKQKQKNPCQY